MGDVVEKRGNGDWKKDHKGSRGKIAQVPASIDAAKNATPVVLKLRLFVGGLGPTVGASDLEQRFAPLGTVHRIDLVDGKKGWDAEEALQRGFAYVDFEASTEASLRKLFSAYNGCKWKGGVLRVEKAKEYYMDRLRREWAEAEAESFVKARVAEKAAANDGGIAADEDEIAAQIEKERKQHQDLLTKLFPEDEDVVDGEEEVIEFAKLRAFPMPTAVNGKKRKLPLEAPSVPVASSSAQPFEGDPRGGSARKSSTHKPGDLELNDKQKSKSRGVKFSGEVLEGPIGALQAEKVMAGHHNYPADSAKGVRSILKKTQQARGKMGVDDDAVENEEELEEHEEQDYYPSSRSPSPEGGFVDESKWDRLFKYAGLKKGPVLTKPSEGVSTILHSGSSLWSGINLDYDDDEPAVTEGELLHRDAAVDNGLFSGDIQENTLELNPKEKKSRVKATRRDGDGSDGIFTGNLCDVGEDAESPQQPSVLCTEIQGNGPLKKSRNLIEEPKTCPDTLPDQGEESSQSEDILKRSREILSDPSIDSESDEEEDKGEGLENFIESASTRKSPGPAPLSEVERASKWSKMFKSANIVVEPVEGLFSGSLDAADVPVKPRAGSVQRMFESAVSNHTEQANEASRVSVVTVTSGESTRRSLDETASTRSDIPIHDVPKPARNDTTDSSDEEEEGADDQQIVVRSGNLLARFDMERDKPHTTGTPLSEDLQPTSQGGLEPGKARDSEDLGVSNSTPPGELNAVNENTKWMQRATWKSLMGADGRATFSLKQITGESETTKGKTTRKEAAVPEQSIGAFSFHFARNPPAESRGSKRKSFHPELAEHKTAKSDSAEKISKSAKFSGDEAGCSFMKSADAEKAWRASKSEIRIDSKAKHKAAVRKMKKMKGSGGAR